MNQRIVHEKDNYRVIAISDIHGHLQHIKGLVAKLNLRDEDYLVIVGDFINKGPDSYGTYKYIRQLEKRPNTYILKGNHEAFITKTLQNDKDDFLSWLQCEHYETIISAMLNNSSKSIHQFSTGDELHEFMMDAYGEDFNYLSELPIMLQLDEFIFVHGGYEERFDPIEEEIRFLKYDYYNEKGTPQEKTVIVGHWPASNLRSDIYSNLPLFNEEKNIITIDGGLGVKAAGELNAFILEKKDGQVSYDLMQYNDFNKKPINKTYIFPEEETLLLNYTDWVVEIIEVGPLMTRCRHISSGKELSVFNCLLKEKEGKYHLATTYVNNFFNLDIGTEVALCQTYDEVALVKYEQDFGWILTSQIE